MQAVSWLVHSPLQATVAEWPAFESAERADASLDCRAVAEAIAQRRVSLLQRVCERLTQQGVVP
jgi:hypothetical protein